MRIIPTHMTVTDYCGGLKADDIKVNRDYQRSNQVWPPAAQSFLIESILLGYPVPKLALYQVTDRVSRRTYREIIDGQQRTEAIRSFYDGELRLSRALDSTDFAGKTYEQLDGDYQDAFLSYPLAIDLFIDATPQEVREVFRRINAYEVPLLPEEQRHARWQGDFKWFVYHLSARNDQTLKNLGTFSEKQLVRMQDMKLLAEVAHALINGITTTNQSTLNRLYEAKESFPEADEMAAWIDHALDVVGSIEVVKEGPLSKGFSVYSLLLAVIHAEHGIPALRPPSGGQGLKNLDQIEASLGVLADALEQDDTTGKHGAFVRASDKGTNVAAQRRVRFEAYLEAIAK